MSDVPFYELRSWPSKKRMVPKAGGVFALSMESSIAVGWILIADIPGNTGTVIEILDFVDELPSAAMEGWVKERHKSPAIEPFQVEFSSLNNFGAVKKLGIVDHSEFEFNPALLLSEDVSLDVKSRKWVPQHFGYSKTTRYEEVVWDEWEAEIVESEKLVSMSDPRLNSCTLIPRRTFLSKSIDRYLTATIRARDGLPIPRFNLAQLSVAGSTLVESGLIRGTWKHEGHTNVQLTINISEEANDYIIEEIGEELSSAVWEDLLSSICLTISPQSCPEVAVSGRSVTVSFASAPHDIILPALATLVGYGLNSEVRPFLPILINNRRSS